MEEFCLPLSKSDHGRMPSVESSRPRRCLLDFVNARVFSKKLLLIFDLIIFQVLSAFYAKGKEAKAVPTFVQSERCRFIELIFRWHPLRSKPWTRLQMLALTTERRKKLWSLLKFVELTSLRLKAYKGAQAWISVKKPWNFQPEWTTPFAAGQLYWNPGHPWGDPIWLWACHLWVWGHRLSFRFVLEFSGFNGFSTQGAGRGSHQGAQVDDVSRWTSVFWWESSLRRQLTGDIEVSSAEKTKTLKVGPKRVKSLSKDESKRAATKSICWGEDAVSDWDIRGPGQ